MRKYSTLKVSEGRFPRVLHVPLSALGLHPGAKSNFRYSCCALLCATKLIRNNTEVQLSAGSECHLPKSSILERKISLIYVAQRRSVSFFLFAALGSKP